MNISAYAFRVAFKSWFYRGLKVDRSLIERLKGFSCEDEDLLKIPDVELRIGEEIYVSAQSAIGLDVSLAIKQEEEGYRVFYRRNRYGNSMSYKFPLVEEVNGIGVLDHTKGVWHDPAEHRNCGWQPVSAYSMKLLAQLRDS